ncbi:hypothetical protein [Catenuloplanes indicus]|uniref:Ricin B lectin domain-containing protein n=1 Tax=Catenuloplanes indicus TaxID=137267 RepID=A0AAE3W8H6_9ACTN|nr:hypothetical protein [Catenuloplanes indicus]MDQ0370619.1 hypothetical protein [Catenuloplanes indicus]
MRIKARYAAVVAGALAAMAVPGAAQAGPVEGPAYLRNVGLDGCLTAVGDDGRRGALVRVKPCDGSFAQLWLMKVLHVDADDQPVFTIRKSGWECLELIGEELPDSGRLALRDCDEGNPYQVFRASTTDWSAPVWRVSGPLPGAWLRAYHEHEAPYVAADDERPGAFAEWEHLPIGA